MVHGTINGIAFLVLAVIAVALRFYTKGLIKAKYAADDWWILISLGGFAAWIGIEFAGIFSNGRGNKIQSLPLDMATFRRHIKIVYTLTPFYGLTVTSSRLSILCLYRRIFVLGNFQKVSLVVGVLCAVWWLVFTIVSLNPCRPVRKFWMPETPGQCFNFNNYILVIGIIDLFMDATILVLPIRPVLNLQMSMTRKAMVCGIFLVGGFVILTGIIRSASTYVPHSAYFNFKRGEFWNNFHLGTAILCACLPVYRAMLSRFANFAVNLSNRIGSLLSSRKTLEASESGREHPKGSFTKGFDCYGPVDDVARLQTVITTDAFRSGSIEKIGHGEHNRITVEHSVEMV